MSDKIKYILTKDDDGNLSLWDSNTFDSLIMVDGAWVNKTYDAFHVRNLISDENIHKHIGNNIPDVPNGTKHIIEVQYNVKLIK